VRIWKILKKNHALYNLRRHFSQKQTSPLPIRMPACNHSDGVLQCRKQRRHYSFLNIITQTITSQLHPTGQNRVQSAPYRSSRLKERWAIHGGLYGEYRLSDDMICLYSILERLQDILPEETATKHSRMNGPMRASRMASMLGGSHGLWKSPMFDPLTEFFHV
jgi:hypothetical protein